MPNTLHKIGLKAGFSDIFVARPILSVVVNLLIIIAGVAAYLGVDVREMPNVDQPILSVSANFSGAAPEVVDTEVTAVLEAALSALDGVQTISANSSFGSSRITLDLSSNVDINTAANEAREIISGISRQLPDDVEATVRKNDADADPIIRVALLGSASLDTLTTLAEGRVSDLLQGIDGIASIDVAGAQADAYRVTLDMVALTARGLTIADVTTALAALEDQAALGSLESETQTLTLKSQVKDTLTADIEDLRINEYTRLKDVAFVQLTAQERNVISRVNGQSAVALNIMRQSLSNTLSISQDVRAAITQLQMDLPENVQILITADDGVFIEQALNEVLKSILLAVAIVILVIFAFLQSWRATIIPALTIPIALIGTLAAIWLAGFSINTISLLALVLATGMVVDDAIVVVENVVRLRQQGMGRRAAAAQGANEVFFAVISTTATLAAVFIPISFLPGRAGGIFAEFGFVLAFCVTVSSFVALTLVPMLAATLDPGALEAGATARGPGVLTRIYLWLVDKAIAFPIAVLGIVLAFGLWTYGVYGGLNSALTPTEDRGSFMIGARAPSGVSVDFTDAQVRQVETILAPLMESGEITSVLSLVGQGGGTNSGMLIVFLDDWAQRSRSQQQILAEINPQLSQIAGISASARAPNSLGIRGGGSGLTFTVAGPDADVLVQNAENLVAAMGQYPETFTFPQLSTTSYNPEIAVSVDADLVRELGLNLASINTTIRGLTTDTTAANVFLNGSEVPIVVAAGGAPINDPTDLDRAFVRTSAGHFIPLSSVASFDQVAGLSRISREGGNRGVAVQAALADGVDLGAAIETLQTLARSVLTDGTMVVLTGEAATLDSSENGTLMVFGLAFIIVTLVLAAQFESIASAVTIMLTVPFGIGAAVVAIWLTGGSLNYYSQIGLVMLIGIMAKNGILIVEFANQLRAAGKDIDTALRDAVALRLRPVMMTMVSTVLGGLPLVVATGAGGEARVAIGWVVVGGLGFATVFTLFLTPALYRLIAPLGQVPGTNQRALDAELAAGAKSA